MGPERLENADRVSTRHTRCLDSPGELQGTEPWPRGRYPASPWHVDVMTEHARLRRPGTPAGALALQRTVGNRAVLQQLHLQRCGTTPPESCACRGSAGSESLTLQGLAHARCRSPADESQRHDETILQRDDSPVRPGDSRLEDPGFLICTAFCYLGIPPSSFKDVIQSMLECLWEELRAAGDANYEQRFAAAREELAAYSKTRLLAKAFRFLMHGELGPGGIIRISARSQAIRERVIARLLALGATHAGLVAAEAVVRKAVFVIDAAIAAGCGTYCGAIQIGQRMVELTEAVAQGLAGAMRIVEGFGQGLAQLVADSLASAYGQLAPANWRLDPRLPERTRADLTVLGHALWAQVRPGSPWTARRPGQTDMDAFLTNVGRSLTDLRVPRSLMGPVATALQNTIEAVGGSAQLSVDQLMAMSPAGLVSLLRDNGLLNFRQDPIAFAHADIAQETTGQASR